MEEMSSDYFRGKGSGYKKGYEAIMSQIKSFTWPLILRFVEPKPGMRVLDIGCAFGYLLRYFDEIGCETYGVDISEYAIKEAQRVTKARLYVWDVDKGLPMFKDEYFDLITMMHVIEHLKAPFYVLREVYRVLRFKGKVIITTPNLNSLGRLALKILGKEREWYGFKDVTHRYLFTPSSLRFLVERTGFHVVTVEAPFMPLRMSLLNRILGRLGLGGSILVVAEKLG